MRKRAAIALAAIIGATPAAAHPTNEATERVEREIAGQVSLWNRGELESVLQTYCPSNEISWVNSGGLSHGFERFAASMREEFGRGRDAMGTLAIEVLESRDLGHAGQLAVVRWSIMRGGTRLMGGVSSQLWAPCEARLRVVFEHAS